MAAKKFYLSSVATTPPVGGTSRWQDRTTNTSASELTDTPQGAPTSVSGTSTSTAANYNVLLHRWISQPMQRAGTLRPGTATIVGLVTAVSCNAAATNSRSSYTIFVLTPDNSIRGSVMAALSGGPAWTTTLTGKIEDTPPGAMPGGAPSIDCQPGDRLVVEFGFDDRVTTAGTRTGTLRYGGTATTDLAVGDTGTNAQTRPPHITFADPDSSLLWEEDDDPDPEPGGEGVNLSPNPTATNNTTNWYGVSWSRVTGQAVGDTGRTTSASYTFNGQWSAGGGPAQMPGSPSTTDGKTLTYVMWVRSTIAVPVRAYFSRHNNGGWVDTFGTGTRDQNLVANTWTKIRRTAVVPAGSAYTHVGPHLDLYDASTGAGTMQIGAVRIVEGDDPDLEYADGDSAGWDWDGTPGNSTSRAVDDTPSTGPEPGRFFLVL